MSFFVKQRDIDPTKYSSSENNITPTPIKSIDIELNLPPKNAANSFVIPEKANKLQEITLDPAQLIPKSLKQYEPFNNHPSSDPPSDPRGAYFLCHPHPRTKPISTVLARDEPSRSSYFLQYGSGGQTSSDLSTKPNLLGSSSLGGNETRHGNLQQPHLVVNSPSISSELPIPIDPVLPSPHMGNATVQPYQPGNAYRTLSPPNFLYPYQILKALVNPVNQKEKVAPFFFKRNLTIP
ncbi:hypothetical protein KY289_017226 [Solanum tuberosum]|nr:hypothetical protein KY289_017226 [Solanum tuberosum]